MKFKELPLWRRVLVVVLFMWSSYNLVAAGRAAAYYPISLLMFVPWVAGWWYLTWRVAGKPKLGRRQDEASSNKSS